MITRFKITTTPTFDKEVLKLARSDKSLKNKLERAEVKLKEDPFQGQRIEGSRLEERRIWVGDSQRLFYDIDGQNVVLLHIKKKAKYTYK